ncbi:hypothetical protein QUB80_23400 [Chlorogloeopsis sp. ULAP01]|uniref:hypothetical protein n=1 Tax=Chlorogloeopsis sp. ULAP01 TaxID=3056483 RepID=UPI0025AACAF7|nr:hypothetical protein [Chlorogloeopsis sp. ULAP01]MDM9383635.1 hypothetical protein [Chlorogloeopsis sp. ULAP01]
MKKRNTGLLFAAISVVSLTNWFLPSPSVASSPTVQLKTEPSLDKVLPSSEPVKLTLQVVDPQRQPLSNTNLQLKLLTPAPTPWLTSDFPIVEGTKLLEFNATAPSGKLQFEQVIPIRGTYQLQAKVTPKVVGAFKPFEQTLTFSVPEKPVKYRNVAILAAILLLAGFGGGWVIGGRQTVEPGEIAPQRVRVLLSGATIAAIAALLIVNISAERASTHAHSAHSHATTPAIQKSGGLEVRLSGDTNATVGQTATQTVQVTDAVTRKPVNDVTLNIQAIALEDNELMFAYKTTPNDQGKFTWQEQFFDGVPHQVVVEVSPQASAARQFQPFKVAQFVEVEGIEPPLSRRFISLGYFTGIFVLGLAGGLVLRRRRNEVAYQSV